MRKPFSYDTIHLGELLGVREVRITDGMSGRCRCELPDHYWQGQERQE
jgi:hypothetical protein